MSEDLGNGVPGRDCQVGERISRCWVERGR